MARFKMPDGWHRSHLSTAHMTYRSDDRKGIVWRVGRRWFALRSCDPLELRRQYGEYRTAREAFAALGDVSVGRWWLRWDDVCGIANGLGIRHVPDLGMMPLHEAETLCRDGFDSEIGTAKAEGVVCRPGVSLYDHAHRRIIVKIKARDYA